MNKRPLSVVLCAALAGLPAMVGAQEAASANAAIAGLDVAEAPRITQAAAAAAWTTLADSRPAAVVRAAAGSAVDDAQPMAHLQLVLKRSAKRQAALDQLMSDQHDPSSPRFHQWLTPAQFGQNFGVADADIAALSAWLSAQGFSVNGVYPNKLQIDFSGTAGLVRRAFRTQERRYTVNRASHIANDADISVPAAFADVVAGVAGLNDLHPQALRMPFKTATLDPASHRFKPAGAQPAQADRVTPEAVTSSFTNGQRGLAPYDLAKIYGADKLHAAGITGKGISIAVVEVASMVPEDWKNFVSTFGLGGYGGSFTQLQPQAKGFANCQDPALDDPGQDFDETLLDAEWATAIAPGAHVEVASCANGDNFFGGVITAAVNLVNGDQRPDIISASYGFGEDAVDAASKTAIDQLWAQADVEGISVFVSTGDSGANPDFNGSLINGAGLSANALATSANVTAVGGTDFADELDHTTATYFSQGWNAQFGSALSYVPEIPWNWSCGNDVAAKSMGFASAVDFCKQQLAQNTAPTSEAGSGGPSGIDRKPAWQRLVRNAAKDQSRDLPDVALYAGSFGDATRVIVCDAAHPCVPGLLATVDLSGGTSLAAPMFAGIQALVDQGLAGKGLPAKQGNAAPTLYALAAQEYAGATGAAPASLAACDADNGTKGTANCVFHNVTRGSISSQCAQIPTFDNESTPDCFFYGTTQDLLVLDNNGLEFVPAKLGLTSTSAGSYTAKTAAYAAQPGWSFAAGLGSVDAKNLLKAWKTFVGVD